MKINTKHHGFNHHLKANTTGSFLKRAQPIIFGADLTHEVDKPLVFAMVASMHAPAILYEEVLAVQKLLELVKGTPGRLLSFRRRGSASASLSRLPRAFRAEGTRLKKSEIILHMEDLALVHFLPFLAPFGRADPPSSTFNSCLLPHLSPSSVLLSLSSTSSVDALSHSARPRPARWSFTATAPKLTTPPQNHERPNRMELLQKPEYTLFKKAMALTCKEPRRAALQPRRSVVQLCGT